MAKGLLFKALLFIAESQDLNGPAIPRYPFQIKALKTESPPSEWSSDSNGSSTPVSSQRTPIAYSEYSTSSTDEDPSLSSSGDWLDELDVDVFRAPVERRPRERGLSEGCSARGWGDTTFAPWLANENETPGRREDQSRKERSMQSSSHSRSCPPTDACPICVRPMSCMERLFAPSCGYLCHLSCMQRTLRNNLENERGNRPLNIHSMRCPICFAMHPLAHGVQFSHVRRGDPFPPPGRDGSLSGRGGSPNFLPGEFRRVLQPTKAAHTRGYASEADGVADLKRTSGESAFTQLRKTKSMDCGAALLDETAHKLQPGPRAEPPRSPVLCAVKYATPIHPPPRPPLSAKAHSSRNRGELFGSSMQYSARGLSPLSEGSVGHKR